MMYGNSGASNPYADAAPAAPPQKPTAKPQEEKGEEATAVIPKELLGGQELKPGEPITLEIVKLTEDGAVVKLHESPEEEHEEQPPPQPAAGPPPGAGGGMAAMMH